MGEAEEQKRLVVRRVRGEEEERAKLQPVRCESQASRRRMVAQRHRCALQDVLSGYWRWQVQSVLPRLQEEGAGLWQQSVSTVCRMLAARSRARESEVQDLQPVPSERALRPLLRDEPCVQGLLQEEGLQDMPAVQGAVAGQQLHPVSWRPRCLLRWLLEGACQD